MKNNNIYEKIVFCGGLLGILLTILNIVDKLSPHVGWIKIGNLSFITEYLNIAVLMLFYFLIKPTELNFQSDSHLASLANFLNIEDQDFTTVKFNIQRVNSLVVQVTNNLKYFIIFLIAFYIFNLLDDYNKTNQFLSNYSDFIMAGELITNLISAAFVFLSFNVLYNSTLDGKNSGKDYYSGTVAFVLLYIISYVMLLLVAHEGRSANNQLIKNLVEIIFPLICGIYNGLAMGLLFGRFISMEFYFKEIYENQSWLSRILYNYGVVFLLPIYVLAQPMYGLLKLDTFERLGSFEGIVFLVCFMGKSIFLLVMYAYLTSKLLHVYLHLLVANHGIPKSLAEIFPQIGRSDSVTVIESNGQDPEPVQVSLAEQEIISPYLINVEGKFDYECINHDNQHRHGGECNIELITNSDNILELRMIGLRCWQKDNNGPKIMVDPPMRWDTNKGVIFKDRTYMYSFLIILPKGSSVGVSKGDVRLSTDGKFIEQFSGTYFQQLGDQIFLGSELFTKKATFPFIENAAAANSV